MKEPVSACPLEQTLLLLTGRWRPLILYWLGQGQIRFNELQRASDGISPRMRSLDLRELETAGVVSRTVLPAVSAHVEYALTDASEWLIPLLAALGEWWETTHEERSTASGD